jgi:hypothetical protein
VNYTMAEHVSGKRVRVYKCRFCGKKSYPLRDGLELFGWCQEHRAVNNECAAKYEQAIREAGEVQGE